MDTWMPMREFARIGKKMLITVLGVTPNYKRGSDQGHSLEEVEVDFSTCPSHCELKDVPIEDKATYCKQNCQYQIFSLPKGIYVNEMHRYRIQKDELLKNKKRLSKYQLLQFILYHLMTVDSNGFIKYVSIKAIASLLGCNVRTVKNNNIELSKLGLISTMKYTSDIFSVHITKYKEYHQSRKQNGSGYFRISKELFVQLVSAKSVNEIRASLRLALEQDNKSISAEEYAITTYQDIKQSLPKNISYPKIIKKTLEGVTGSFDIQSKDSIVMFKLRPEFNEKLLRAKKEKQFTQQIRSILGETTYKLSPEDMNDLVQLSMEYGVTYLCEALSLYKEQVSNEEELVVENVGGFVRSLIKKTVFQKFIA
ncbi:hypothetical protein PP175_27135 (plasmid) [Aneurinibacillus sp. Ricciae_BoGa-3]|uniref:hypothetical protein n=1 Tax=Aneurinibacillus sp. Ricciae_BoGa-3 TaxID=3022697 RepID=UPI00234279E7|nr:hypothetical protein [Aneurinibacillus sp. Ricciae_BoGa-3]WCK57714.1 hypothetical protein PP175_27135 [Aneurinibacillus sp. Ricciae_BoGa-3]